MCAHNKNGVRVCFHEFASVSICVHTMIPYSAREQIIYDNILTYYYTANVVYRLYGVSRYHFSVTTADGAK